VSIKRDIDLERLRILFEKDGLSVNAISKIFGASRGCINTRLVSIGITPPGIKESRTRLYKTGFKASVDAAHKAVKGTKRTEADLVRRAAGKAGRMESFYEEMFFIELLSFGYAPSPGFAVGKYNIDLAYPDIKLAVEIDGGEWHASSPIKIAQDNNKRSFLESLGWIIVRYKVTVKTAVSVVPGYCGEIISLVERLRGLPFAD
jgi:very-short-patch-repair endonuclease